MLIRNGNDFLEMIPLERVAEHLPTPGDTRFAVRIQSGAFSGQGTTWIDFSALQKFADDMKRLERTRSGHAETLSISPNEFRLVVSTIDGWGHVAVSGRLARNKQAVEFCFEFSSEVLSMLCNDVQELSQT